MNVFIFTNVCKYLNYNDICNLKLTHKRFYEQIITDNWIHKYKSSHTLTHNSETTITENDDTTWFLNEQGFIVNNTMMFVMVTFKTNFSVLITNTTMKSIVVIHKEENEVIKIYIPQCTRARIFGYYLFGTLIVSTVSLTPI